MDSNPFQSPVIPAEAEANSQLIAAVRMRLRLPAILILGLVSLNVLVDVALFLAALWQGFLMPMDHLAALSLVMLTIHLIEAYCARHLLTLQSHNRAISVALLMTLPVCSPFLIVGVPLGWWTFYLLGNPEVSAAFQQE